MIKKTVVIFTGHRADTPCHEGAMEMLWSTFDSFFQKMLGAGCELLQVKHGGAKGSDTAFNEWLEQSPYSHLKKVHRPDYNAGHDPLVAPLIRNREMVDEAYSEEMGADRVVLIAIYDGRKGGGTAQTIAYYDKQTEARGQLPKKLIIPLQQVAYEVLSFKEQLQNKKQKEKEEEVDFALKPRKTLTKKT